MKLFAVFILLPFAFSLPLFQKKLNDARVCNPNPQSGKSDYTGSRIDRQIIIDHDKILAIQLHMSICDKGALVSKYIKDESIGVFNNANHLVNHFDEVIPWNQTLCDGNTNNPVQNCFKLARRKTFALRPISIYNPGDFVGGLFQLAQEKGSKLKDSIDESFIPIGKLVADSVYNQWLEIHKDSKMKIYHIPLLYTPNVENVMIENKDQWYSSISANELYNYSFETKNMFKNSLQLSLNQVKNVVKNTSKKLKTLNNQLSDSRPIRKAIKSMNYSKTVNFLSLVFKDKINELSKFRFNKEEIDFDTMMVISQILTKDQYLKFSENLNSIYNKFQIPEQMFSYPKLKN